MSGLYYVETYQGCGLKAAANITAARASAIREVGTDNFKSVRKATAQDIAWVRGMGGYVPTIAERLTTRKAVSP